MNISNKSNQNKQQVVLQQQTISSPLPPPEWMERYSKINPDIVNEILDEFKKNGENGRQISLKIVDNESQKIKLQEKEANIIKLSQWHGFIATAFIISIACFMGLRGYQSISLTLAGASCVGIIRVLSRKK